MGVGRLIGSSIPLSGGRIRCVTPLSPTYVVHEVSKMAEDSAHLYLLRASLRKAALSLFRASVRRSCSKLILFSKLAGRQREATAKRVVTQSLLKQ
jgi:hypothetical protein